MNDPFVTITVLAAALAAGETSAEAIATDLLARIRRLDPALRAFVRLTEERALAEARASDRRRAQGAALGPLDGIPYAAKDLLDVAGCPTMAGCSLLADWVAAADCMVVARLAAAGMVLIGKTHTVQFACDITGINHDMGTPLNPWSAVPHIPGGSSSGSAVAVAAGMVPMAIGSDTGGSIRVPAALCGTVGLKTTVGRISRAGVYPLSWTLDSLGPLTRSVADAALVLEALQGPDPADDATMALPPVATDDLDAGVAGLSVAICRNHFFDRADAETAAAVQAAAETLRSLGARVDEVVLPEIDEAYRHAREGLIISTESYAYNRVLLETERDRLDPISLWMEAGRGIDAAAYFLAQRARADLQLRFNRRLDGMGIDALIVPASLLPARPVEVVDADRRASGIHVHNTSVGNYLNLTGLSVPCGFTDRGLPIGALINGRPGAEAMVLRIGQAYERATGWHGCRPTLDWAEAAA